MDWASEMNRPSEEPAVTPTGCVMSRLSASGPHQSSLWRRLRPRENAVTLLRGARACVALLAALAVLALVAPEQAEAQTDTTFISNSAQVNLTSSSFLIRATAFTTGSNSGGYGLSSVDVYVGTRTTFNPLVEIYVDNAGAPGTLHATLSDPATVTGNSANTFTATNTTLSATTTYWLVTSNSATISNAVNPGQGFRVNTTTNTTVDPGAATGWSIGNGRFKSDINETNWTASSNLLVFTIKGTLGAAPVTNNAPTVANEILDQTATEGEAFSFAFPTNTFADTDAGDTLTYTAMKSDDSALPSWLSFDAATRTFSGTPTAANVGTVSVKVTASDGTDSVSNTFDIVVSAAAGVTVSKSALTVTEEDMTGNTYTVVLDTRPTADVTVTIFGHGGGTDVTLTSFAFTSTTPSSATLTFTTANWNQAQTVTVKAGDDTDTANDTVTLTHFAASSDGNYNGITIGSVVVTVEDNDTANTAPTVANPIQDQTATAGTALNFAFPTNTFNDADSDTLTYTATKSDDSALPSWLSFAAATRTFSGTPMAADVETVSVKVTASDGNGGSVSAEFDIVVTEAITVSYVPLEYEVSEDARSVDLRISVTSHPTSGTPRAFSVLLSSADGTATAADDYIAISGQLIQFDVGDISKDHEMEIIDDSVAESDETFTSTLSIDLGPAVIDTRTDFGATATITITDDDTNTPPTSADERVEADEDFDYTFASDDFAFTDTDTGDSLASVKIVTLPASGTGTLTLSDTAIGSGDLPKTVPADEIDDLKYSPPANLYGTDVASFTFKVNDGTVDSDNAYTITIDVKGEDDSATGAPTITGTAQVGQTLTAVTTGIMDADGLTSPTYTYQWIRANGTEADIASANSSTYILVAADLGKTIKVKVSFADDASNPETLTSAATATVVAAPTAPMVSDVDVTSSPASGDTYGTGEMIRFTVTFDQAVTVTGTPEFEFCLGTTSTMSCDMGATPPARRRAALSSGSGTTALVFGYTVVAGDVDDNGIWTGDQSRTIKLEGGTIQGTVGGLDAVLTHAEEGEHTGHKVNGAAANTAPTAANNTVTTAEDRAYTFTAADFGFMDADTGAALASVKIVTVPAAGTLAFDGTAVMAADVVTKAQIDGDMLTFTPARDAHGDAYTTFTFKVNDGTDDSASAYTMTIDVTDAPAPVCTAPSYGDRREIWSGTVTVGLFTVFPGTPLATNHYGYSSTAPAGALDDQTFTIGSNDYTVNSLRVQFGGRNSGSLGFELLDAQRLTTVEVEALRLHVCDTVVYNFSGATTLNASYWSTTFDWSPPVVTRMLYLSLPANNVATGEPAITGTAQVGQDADRRREPHRGRRRAALELHLQVVPRGLRRHLQRGGDFGRDRHHLHPDERRRGQEDQGQSELHRRAERRGNAHQRGVSLVRHGHHRRHQHRADGDRCGRHLDAGLGRHLRDRRDDPVHGDLRPERDGHGHAGVRVLPGLVVYDVLHARHAPAGSAERRLRQRLGHDDAGVQLHGRGRRHGRQRHLDRQPGRHAEARRGGHDRGHDGRAHCRAHPRGGGPPDRPQGGRRSADRTAGSHAADPGVGHRHDAHHRVDAPG